MRMQRTPSNLFDLDWLGQPGLFNLPINVACNSVHSATSIISFTAGVMVRIYPEVIYDGHGLRNHSKTILKLMPNVQPVFLSKRSVPLATLSTMDEEPKHLRQTGLLKPVSYSE
ncbi:unnamed protein product [Hymenolepis diminuta]|uniref:Uncharacterized protein n=1 Tax=Hymenolepis diminuta TaxID=6216 RepID=A0A564YUV3_HYMDI|nr:unnamed protein product [Hymenolepis diminuta]